MACSSCGKNRSAPPAQMMAAPALTVNPNFVSVIYRGSIGNHFIPSPLRLVKHYGYFSHGDQIDVDPRDVQHSPHLFFPASFEVAMRVWPNYPSGVPAEVVLAYGLTKAEAIKEDAEVVRDDPPVMPKRLAPKAQAPKRKKVAAKNVGK